MNIAVCDDDKYCLNAVSALAEKYTQTRHDVSFSFFDSADSLMEKAEKIGGFDLYILDIVMPVINGIELGKALRELGYDGKIIYLTSSEEFAIDAFKVKAFNYIIKPVKEDELFGSIDEALEALRKKRDRYIIVKTKERSVKLPFDNIINAQNINRVISYRMTKGRTEESVTLRTSFSEAVQELLRDERFFLCGTSTLINLEHITALESEYVVFSDESRLYFSPKLYREIRSAWYGYCFDEEV